MRITLQTHGGIAAAIPRKPVCLETDALGRSQAQELIHLVESVMAAVPAAVPTQARPDALTYALTVAEGARTQTVKQREPYLTPEFAALLSHIARHSKPVS